jgi:O-methyltransferase involved in polyketide biosynthesis
MSEEPADRLRTDIPHSARVWDYWLGGKDNFAVDREVGDRVIELYPDIVRIAREVRRFLARSVRYLASVGVTQFLDIGTGLPTAANTHEIAQGVVPSARIVYVDNDPLVLTHARALLTSTPEGATRYIDADLRDTAWLLHAAGDTLDFTQPIAVMLLGIVGYIPDYNYARAIVRQLMEAVPSGSYLVLHDGTSTAAASIAAGQSAQRGGLLYHVRTVEQIAGFFDGLDLVPPGVVTTPLWRPDVADPPTNLAAFCGVARKS